MNANFTNGLIGAGVGVLIAGTVAVGYVLTHHPLSDPPYPPTSGCNGVAWNTSGAANIYQIVFTPPTGSSITVRVDFKWDDTPGFHHNVQMPGGNWFDIVQHPCTRAANGLTLRLHPPSSIQSLADPKTETDWNWNPVTNQVKVITSNVANGVPLHATGTAVLQ